MLRCHPRLFLRHFAKEIQEAVPPKSRREQQMSGFLGLLIGAPLIFGLLWRAATLRSRAFDEIFAYIFGVLFVFNVADLLILDWLIVCWWQPRWVRLPGTESIVVPSQYLHHFRGFLVGTFALAVVGLIAAGLFGR